jgi:hypothetical protein
MLRWISGREHDEAIVQLGDDQRPQPLPSTEDLVAKEERRIAG